MLVDTGILVAVRSISPEEHRIELSSGGSGQLVVPLGTAEGIMMLRNELVVPHVGNE